MTNKAGPREQALREKREQESRLLSKDPVIRQAQIAHAKVQAKRTAAALAVITEAISPTQSESKPEESKMLTVTPTKGRLKPGDKVTGALKGKIVGPRKTKTAKKSKPKAPKSKPKTVLSGPNGAIVALLRRPDGATTADILKLTGWPTVSVPAQAAAAGVEYRSEKGEDGVTRYWAT